jgi:formylglycine-generating enzyme required for sulfatase activity
LTTPSAAIERRNCPFIGLRPFDEPDAPRFFGRTEQIAALLRRLGETRFLAVVGTSGCGKSSLVRAGLIPSLKRGYLASAGSRWRIAVMRPGSDPFGALTAAVNIPQEDLRRSSLGLVKALQGSLDAQESMLLVVDQFEELFRFRRETGNAGGQSDAFVKLLLASAAQDEVPIYVVLTMRSDYLGDCAVFRGLPEALNDAQYLVPVLTRLQLREVVEAPVAGAGAHIAPELVQRVLNDVGYGLEQELDQLPVLQHALMRTWGEAAEARAAELGLEHYRKSRGMEGALNQHAEGLYAALDVEDRALAKRVFQRLAEKEFKGRDIRRPSSFGELRTMTGASEEQLKRVIGQFQDFLTSRPEPPLTDASMIDISHEALIRQWKHLREWAEEEAHLAHAYLRLNHDASRGGRPWDDPDLQEALDLQKANGWNAAWAQRYTQRPEAYRQVEEFLSRSKRHRAWKRVQRWGLAMAALAIVAAAYFWQVQKTKDEAELQRRQAELQRKDAELQTLRTRSLEAATRAERLLAEAANARGQEKTRLEVEAAKARADSDRFAASTKDYQSLTQRRDAEVTALQKSRDALNAELKKAKDDNSRLSGEKDDLQKKLTAAEADKATLTRKLEVAEKEKGAAAPRPAVAPPVAPGAEKEKKTRETSKPTPENPLVKVNLKDGLPYVWIPPGDFSMGCSPGDSECYDNEKPVRKVTITKGYWMGQTEVTQAAYRKVIRSNPSQFKGENRPVEQVSWTDAARYCALAGGRLPTEAEWEYAARGGVKEARYGDLDAIAWYGGNSGDGTHAVGAKKSNSFGLYDMLGNVREWTADRYGSYQDAATVDPAGPQSGDHRVLRGGAWFLGAGGSRASYRGELLARNRYDDVGFRCVGDLP